MQTDRKRIEASFNDLSVDMRPLVSQNPDDRQRALRKLIKETADRQRELERCMKEVQELLPKPLQPKSSRKHGSDATNPSSHRTRKD